MRGTNGQAVLCVTMEVLCAKDVHGIGLKCEVVSANRMLEVVHSTAWYWAAQECSKTRSLNGAHQD